MLDFFRSRLCIASRSAACARQARVESAGVLPLCTLEIFCCCGIARLVAPARRQAHRDACFGLGRCAACGNHRGQRRTVIRRHPPAAEAATRSAATPIRAIVEWASGYQNYVEGSPINASFANPAEALGPFQNSTFDVTELGDGGQITYTFAKPIAASGSGPDFAVFGNSFESTYEKLAYVDVSVDGQTWYRMPNHDLTPSPVGTFGLTDPTNIDGLAGKYQLGYGVGFSLSEVGLTTADYVRIVDVVGNGSNLDSSGNPIYDPAPNSDGFNVAGVGVLSVVPEPSSSLLLLIGLGGLSVARWRSLRKPSAVAKG